MVTHFNLESLTVLVIELQNLVLRKHSRWSDSFWILTYDLAYEPALAPACGKSLSLTTTTGSSLLLKKTYESMETVPPKSCLPELDFYLLACWRGFNPLINLHKDASTKDPGIHSEKIWNEFLLN